jgi:hypothetical protein
MNNIRRDYWTSSQVHETPLLTCCRVSENAVANLTAILLKYVAIYCIVPSAVGRYLDEQDNYDNQRNAVINLGFVKFYVAAPLPSSTHHCVRRWLLPLAWKHELMQKPSQSGTTPPQINILPVCECLVRSSGCLIKNPVETALTSIKYKTNHNCIRDVQKLKNFSIRTSALQIHNLIARTINITISLHAIFTTHFNHFYTILTSVS